jgi:hypothetical protein
MIIKKTSIIVGIALIIISFFAGTYFSSFKKTYEIQGYSLVNGGSTPFDGIALVYDNWVELKSKESKISFVVPRDNISFIMSMDE